MTKEILIKNVKIGGGNKIAVQSMTNTKTHDIDKTVKQILNLEKAGCDIVRVAVPEIKDADAVGEIVKQINIPLCCDIHFDYKLAIACIENGAHKIRFNPGNIGEKENIERLVFAARDRNVPIRIGVNSGSIEKEILKKNLAMHIALVESALKNVRILEDLNFDKIVISVKSADVASTVKAYREISKKFNYPLHLGVTESGFDLAGTVKSSLGIGALLLDGIGDTLRVSLTDDPVKEVEVGKEILRALKKDTDYCEIISCPTCSRCEIDLNNIARKVKDITKDIKKPLKIAVMGCIVNGPGEAEACDLGIAGAKEKSIIFKGGKVLKTVSSDCLLDEFIIELKKVLKEKEN